MAEIDALAARVTTALRTLRYSPGADPARSGRCCSSSPTRWSRQPITSSTPNSSARYVPGQPNPLVESRKEKFDRMNEWVHSRNGWIVSVPGDPDVRLQTLVGSPLPGQLRKLGYIVERTGETQRILPHAVSQRFETSSSGALVVPTEGSTRPVSVVVTTAGIAVVEQYDLRMP